MERLAVALAAAVYKREDTTGVQYLWSGAVNHVQFDIVRFSAGVALVFAGSNEGKDWRRHLLVRRAKVPGFEGVKVHRGWLADWQMCVPTVYAVMRSNLHPEDILLITGHSYGGALANLAALYWTAEIHPDRISLHTFGSPRVGNERFAETMKLVKHNYRYTVKGDLITHLPLNLRYTHAGTHVQFPHQPDAHNIRNYEEAIYGQVG